MTDRELLALAAQSAGFSGFIFEDGRYWIDGPMTDAGIYPQQWNPLADDGDALRLAVGLNLDIRYESHDAGVTVTVGGAWDEAPEAVLEIFERDGPRAVRRAIVRAAALIGRTLPTPTPTTPTGDH